MNKAGQITRQVALTPVVVLCILYWVGYALVRAALARVFPMTEAQKICLASALMWMGAVVIFVYVSK